MSKLFEAVDNLESFILVEASNTINLYPSVEYRDKMKPINITSMKGIIFGYFNDEEIEAFETGFNDIKSLEKAIKDKKYMIPMFEDDKDWGSMSGDECWKYVTDTIEDSHVDGDSYWSMFLLDTSNFKILLCGSEKPDIEKNDSAPLKAKLLTGKSDSLGVKYPYIKIGKYRFYADLKNEEEIQFSPEFFDKMWKKDKFWDDSIGRVSYIEEETGLHLLDYIDNEQKVKFLELEKVFEDKFKEEEEKEKQEELAQQEKEDIGLVIPYQKRISKKIGEQVKIELCREIVKYCEENDTTISPYLVKLMNHMNLDDEEYEDVEHIIDDEISDKLAKLAYERLNGVIDKIHSIYDLSKWIECIEDGLSSKVLNMVIESGEDNVKFILYDYYDGSDILRTLEKLDKNGMPFKYIAQYFKIMMDTRRH